MDLEVQHCPFQTSTYIYIHNIYLYYIFNVIQFGMGIGNNDDGDMSWYLKNKDPNNFLDYVRSNASPLFGSWSCLLVHTHDMQCLSCHDFHGYNSHTYTIFHVESIAKMPEVYLWRTRLSVRDPYQSPKVWSCRATPMLYWSQVRNLFW